MSMLSKIGPSVARGARGLWLLIGATLLFVLLIEGSARLLFYTKDTLTGAPSVSWCDQIMVADGYREATWPVEYCEQHKLLAMEWHPYVYWRHRPHQSKHINVDEHGLRRTWNRPRESPQCGADPIRIFVLGGSTIWGPAVRDDYTVPSHLSKLLADAELCVEIQNLGETAYVTTQELILLQRRLQRGDIPDLVIFYDGVNELFSIYQNNEVGLPQNEDNRRNEFNFLLNPERVRRAYMAQLMRPEGLSRLREVVQKRVFTTDQGAGGVGLQPAQTRDTTEVVDRDQIIDQMLVVYRSNIEIVKLLAEHYGFDAQFYWQPLIFTKKTRSPYEEQWYQLASEQWMDFLLEAYQRVEEDDRLNQLSQFHNIATIFDDLEDPVYVDAFHLSEDGNLIVAQAIAGDVIEVLRESP